MAKNFNQVIVKEYVDKDTGEILSYESEKTFTQKIDKDKFYITYIDFIAPFFQLKSAKAKDLLIWMCNNAEFNTGRVLMPTEVRDKVSKELDISPNGITNNLKALKDLNLISGQKGTFTINPKIFWKGDEKARKAFMNEKEIQIKFSI
jgi:hypothetical protein